MYGSNSGVSDAAGQNGEAREVVGLTDNGRDLGFRGDGAGNRRGCLAPGGDWRWHPGPRTTVDRGDFEL